jgi:hypothetical protein
MPKVRHASGQQQQTTCPSCTRLDCSPSFSVAAFPPQYPRSRHFHSPLNSDDDEAANNAHHENIKAAQDAVVQTMQLRYPEHDHTVDLAATRGLTQLHVAALLDRPDLVLDVAQKQPNLIENRSPNDGHAISGVSFFLATQI